METFERRAIDNERWTKVEVCLGKHETHMEACNNFRKITVENKDEIAKLNTKIEKIGTKMSILSTLGGFLGLAIIAAAVKAFLSLFNHH